MAAVFCYEARRLIFQQVPFEGADDTMAKSKSKHRRVRHTIRLKWKRRLDRKKAAAKAAGAKKKK